MHLRDSKFIINCAARTGSTFLVHLLRSNPKILCHGEVIALDRVGALVGTYGRKRREIEGFEQALHDKMLARPTEFIYDNIFDSQGHRVVGFKYKTDESLNSAYKPYTDIIAGDEEIKVIHLRRRNLLDQYISHQVVLHQTGVTMITSDDEKPEIQPFEADITHAINYLRDVVDREQRSIDLYTKHRCFFADYENLLPESSNDRLDLQRFLDVGVQALTTSTKKIITDNRGLLTNLDQVLEALIAAGFEQRIS